jgi:hypothetical protein
MVSLASLMMPGILPILLVATMMLPAPAIVGAIAKTATKYVPKGTRNMGIKQNPRPSSNTRSQMVHNQERQTEMDAQSNMEKLKSAVSLWHGQGGACKSMRDACAGFVHRTTLSDSLYRTLDLINQEESTTKHPELLRSRDINGMRKVPISRVLRLTVMPAMGRGDSLTAPEIELIKERYDSMCMNFKSAPKSNGTTDPDHDDFARLVNEVFAETRPNFGKKSQSTQFCQVTMLRWAKLCDISFVGLVPAGDYRSSALSNWRNMISNIAGWIGVIHASERKIRPALMFNCDDTTLFLDQKNTKHRTLVSNKAKARGRALHLSFSLSINRKNNRSSRSSKHYAHRQRTVKVNCVTSAIGKLVCTVIQIQDYEITRVQVTQLIAGVYLVLQPGKKRVGSKQQDFDNHDSTSEARVKLATRVLRDCILEGLILEIALQVNASKHALELDSQGSGKFTNSGLNDEDICMEGDRAVLCFDGDYPQIEAILSDLNKTSDGLTLRECFAAHNIELVKFSGGCSMSQQPNDRSRCFFCLKQSIKKFIYKGLKFSLHLFIFFTHSSDLDVASKTALDWTHIGVRQLEKFKIEASSMRTFRWFLYTWGDLSTHAFNSAYVKSGWSLVGLSPFSPEKMMEAWAFLPDLLKFNPNAVDTIKSLMPQCAEKVVETGTISDTFMDLMYYVGGGLFAAVPNSENDQKDTSDAAPVNHR